MKNKTKIFAILMVIAVVFSISAISCFAYDVGTEITLKETYTSEELEAYLTEYKDVDGVYYSGSEEISANLPNLLDLHISFSEIVILYRGSNFSTGGGNAHWVAVGKRASDNAFRLLVQMPNIENETGCITYNPAKGWTGDGVVTDERSFIADGTFTLTDEQFAETGLLWTLPPTKGGTITEILSSIGNGLKSFLPNVAEAGAETVDTLFVGADGRITTFAVITVVGIVCACGKGVFGVIKRKTKKV